MKYSLSRKSGLLFNSLVTLAIFFSLQLFVVQAQDAGFEAGMAGQTANMTSNVIGMNSITINGTAKIKSGKAITTFAHSPNIYSYVASTLIFEAYEPQNRLEQAKLIQEQVKRFESRMIKAGGYKLNDNVY